MLAAYFDPNYVSILKYQNEVIVFLLVSAGLALLVRRSRALVAERAEAERARGNLARYFSPKVVDTLAERDEPLGRVRRQAVGVLFADLVGFTTMAEEMTPEEVMALLRDFHGRMEEEVFRHGGCLEKFIGDALLATFGVPDPGPRDATDTLACARGMLAALEAWNRERVAAGLPALRMGLGLHYGPVVAGDIGSRRSMAFATVGDTTNVTSRLQALTRELGHEPRGQRRARRRHRARGRRSNPAGRPDVPRPARAPRPRHADRPVGRVASPDTTPRGGRVEGNRGRAATPRGAARTTTRASSGSPSHGVALAISRAPGHALAVDRVPRDALTVALETDTVFPLYGSSVCQPPRRMS